MESPRDKPWSRYYDVERLGSEILNFTAEAHQYDRLRAMENWSY